MRQYHLSHKYMCVSCIQTASSVGALWAHTRTHTHTHTQSQTYAHKSTERYMWVESQWPYIRKHVHHASKAKQWDAFAWCYRHSDVCQSQRLHHLSGQHRKFLFDRSELLRRIQSTTLRDDLSVACLVHNVFHFGAFLNISSLLFFHKCVISYWILIKFLKCWLWDLMTKEKSAACS